MCAPICTPSPAPGSSAMLVRPRLSASGWLSGNRGTVPCRSTTNRGILGGGSCANAETGKKSVSAQANAAGRIGCRRLYLYNPAMESKALHDMFVLGLPIVEKIARPILVYVFLIIGLRVAG